MDHPNQDQISKSKDISLHQFVYFSLSSHLKATFFCKTLKHDFVVNRHRSFRLCQTARCAYGYWVNRTSRYYKWKVVVGGIPSRAKLGIQGHLIRSEKESQESSLEKLILVPLCRSLCPSFSVSVVTNSQLLAPSS